MIYSPSCPITELLAELVPITGKPYAELEAKAFESNLYPGAYSIHYTKNHTIVVYANPPTTNWLCDAIQQIMIRDNISRLIITE
jgi:hypothetical protein